MSSVVRNRLCMTNRSNLKSNR